MDSEQEKQFLVPNSEESPETSAEPFDEFIEEVDQMLGLVGEEPGNPEQNVEVLEESLPATDPAVIEMQYTFIAIMQQVLKPVSRYVKAIVSGLEQRELFEIINFTVAPLVQQVEKVELFKHSADLIRFRTALTRILATHFGTLSKEMRDELLKSFQQVQRAFALDLRGNQRAVQNILEFYRLLCFSREIEVEQIRKFFAIGISSITWVRRTPTQELVSLSGMEPGKARLLRKMALAYREPDVELNDAPVSASL